MPTPRLLNDSPSRRQFLKSSTVAGAAVGASVHLGLARSVHAAQSETLKIGLVGCGGRGTGAAVNATSADPNTRLTAMADLFPDQLEKSKKILSRRLGEKFAVTPEQSFTGFDACEKLMQTDVDVVLLAAPPHFRPAHLAAAVEAGKHIFCEKPVAVDGPGCRSVFATSKKASEKKLSLVSGLCWRYDLGVRATIDKIQSGAIGDVVAIQENYLAGTLWHRGRQPDWSDMEFQCRNWLYFNWLSGDHINEQHIHSLDKAMWLNGDEPPVSCVGLGGRQVRTEERFGDIYDHHAVCFDFPKTKVFAYTRQMRGTKNDVDDYVYGASGKATVLRNTVETKDGDVWKYSGPTVSMYDQEHIEMFKSIRSGEPINNGDYMTKSTLMAVMGRMACYTGQEITWEMALNSQETLGPAKYEWGEAPEVKVAMPGVTKFV